MKMYLTMIDNNQTMNNIEINPQSIDGIIEMLSKRKKEYLNESTELSNIVNGIKSYIMPKTIRVFSEITYRTVLKITSSHSREEVKHLDYENRNKMVRKYNLVAQKELAKANVASQQIIKDCLGRSAGLKNIEYYSILAKDIVSSNNNIQIFNSILNKNYDKHKIKDHIEIRYLEEARDKTAELIKNWR